MVLTIQITSKYSNEKPLKTLTDHMGGKIYRMQLTVKEIKNRLKLEMFYVIPIINIGFKLFHLIYIAWNGNIQMV